jgi:hypothetical protein
MNQTFPLGGSKMIIPNQALGVVENPTILSRTSPLFSYARNKSCGKCESDPANLGGLRSCCHEVFKWNPITKQLEWVTECWIEGCTPERTEILVSLGSFIAF